MVGPHASTCRCFSCRQAALARRIGVDLNPQPVLQPQGPPGWLVPLFGGGLIFWLGVFLLI